jgi:hypothetical protein
MTASGWRKRQIANQVENDMSGKGSTPRPFSVSDEEYAARWDAIFGKKDEFEEEYEEEEEIDDSCPSCRHGAMMITGTGLFWACDVCGHRERVEREEP